MSAELKQAVDALFAQEGMRIGNIKFFRGRLANITAEQLIEQIKSANEQVRLKTARPLSSPVGM